MDRDLADIKWELTHESYVKEKFAQYHGWFMQLEKKIQIIDQEIYSLREMLKKMNNQMEMHKEIIGDRLQENKIGRIEKPEDKKSLVPGLKFFDKVFRKKREDNDEELEEKEMYDLPERDRTRFR